MLFFETRALLMSITATCDDSFDKLYESVPSQRDTRRFIISELFSLKRLPLFYSASSALARPGMEAASDTQLCLRPARTFRDDGINGQFSCSLLFPSLYTRCSSVLRRVISALPRRVIDTHGSKIKSARSRITPRRGQRTADAQAAVYRSIITPCRL